MRSTKLLKVRTTISIRILVRTRVLMALIILLIVTCKPLAKHVRNNQGAVKASINTYSKIRIAQIQTLI